ncbi:hypothetical protein HHK36_027806 [Tetracentron sinense]|uniref:rRNA biogenesis protein RRP36 n=1 Tax=Tetracentron sinense TaxID=13715 RepID=A0A835D4R5_TETSI|nr:hypothetical protein HHK36_027806 [Tetracentron sinense]
MGIKKSDKAIATSSKSKVDLSDGYESSSEEEEELERELADVSFEDLQKARSNGSHSLYQKPNPEKKVARANKNRPMEITSKKPVGRFREVIQAPKRVIRDPRFESLCGNLDTDGFRKRYSFLYENDLPAEREELQKLIKKSNDPEVIDESKNRISWIHKQLKEEESAKRIDTQILAVHKKKEREAAKRGKRPFYLKKSEIRDQRLIEKYNDLKAAGKLESFIEKRRRKNASKDHRYVPYRRSNNSEQQN